MLNPLAELAAFQRRRRYRGMVSAPAIAAILRRGIVFVHIPKNGGKTVVREIYGLSEHEYFGHAGIDFYAALLGPSRFSAMTKIAMFRDPVDRCRSGFDFLKGGGFGLPSDLADQDRLADHDFASFVQNELETEMTTGSIVFRPQCDFVVDRRGRVAVDHLLDFAHFSDAIAAYREGGTEGASVSHINRSRHHSNTVTDAATRDTIRGLYAADYQLFGARFGWER